MWFLLRMTLWLGIVLVLLPNASPRSLPKSEISLSEAFSAAKNTVADMQHFCDRQREACVLGSQATLTLSQRAQAGVKIIYEFLSEAFGPDKSRTVRSVEAVPIPPARPSLQDTLRPVDLVSPWRGPRPTDNQPGTNRSEFVNLFAID